MPSDSNVTSENVVVDAASEDLSDRIDEALRNIEGISAKQEVRRLNSVKRQLDYLTMRGKGLMTLSDVWDLSRGKISGTVKEVVEEEMIAILEDDPL